MIVSIIIGFLIFLAFSAFYAGALFFISKVSFLGMTIPTFWDALQFSIVLTLLSMVIGGIIGVIIGFFVAKNPNLAETESNSITVYIISFLSTFLTWFVVDLLFTSITIPLWVLFIFSVLMSLSNSKKVKDSFSESPTDNNEEATKS
ncbi:hypothetical protein [Bacillus toyonensis]|uniref:hypothetical protein n=1 Tax=Bacillus toyonensis TaxID=155322 RepID=UPI002E1C6DB0|nr:hypothetical protein [Bacillus toyonensis]